MTQLLAVPARRGAIVLFLVAAGVLTWANHAEAQEQAIDAVQLPGQVTSIAAGRGGRYLIAQIKKANKLVVVDIKEMRIVKEIATAPDILFAAGYEHLLILDRGKQQMLRWNLLTLKEEISVAANLPGSISAMAMGCASYGPAVCVSTTERVSRGRPLTLFNPVTMKMRRLTVAKWSGPSLRGGELATMSADGGAVAIQRSRSFPGSTLIQLGGSASGSFRMDTPSPISFSSDASFLVSASGVVPRSDWSKFVVRPRISSDLKFAAVRGHYYAHITPAGEGRGDIDIYRWHARKPAQKMLTLTGAGISMASGAGRPEVPTDQRLWFLPQFDRIVTLSAENNRLQSLKLGLLQTLRKNGESYFYIESMPPSQAAAGKLFQHQYQVLSPSPASYRLDLGPPGMKITKDGLLQWNVPASHPTGETRVVVAIGNGTTHYHSFQLAIKHGVGPQKVPAEEIVTAPIKRSLAAAAPPVTPATFSQKQYTLPIPATISEAKLAGGGRFLLLHLKEINKIAVFDICKSRIAKYLPAPAGEFAFAGGLTSAVVYNKEARRLERWSLIDFKLEQTSKVEIAFDEIQMGASSRGPIYTLAGRYSDRTVGFLSLDTLQPLPVKSLNGRSTSSYTPRIKAYPTATASADGKILVSCRDGSGSCGLLSYAGGHVLQHNHDLKMPRKSALAALADGSAVIGAHGVYSPTLIPTSESSTPDRSFAVAAPKGRLFLAVTPQGNWVHYGAEARTVAVAPEIPLKVDLAAAYGSTELRCEQRVHFIPAANIIAVLPASGSEITLIRFDFAATLKKGAEIAYVTSEPPATAARDGFRYQVQTAGSAAVRFSLAACPVGMKISDSGLITWTPPAIGPPQNETVIVRLNAGATTVFHSFKLSVPPGDPWPATFRQWSHKNNGSKAEARVTGYDRGMLTLTRRDGRVFYEPASRFSSEDQQYVTQLLRPRPAPQPDTEPPEPSGG